MGGLGMNAMNRSSTTNPPKRRHELMEKMEKALHLAEDNAAAATERRAQLRGVVFDTLQARYPGQTLTKAVVDHHLDIRAGEDKVYKNFIGQNQWQMQQAVMYANAATAYHTFVLTTPLMNQESLQALTIDKVGEFSPFAPISDYEGDE